MILNKKSYEVTFILMDHSALKRKWEFHLYKSPEFAYGNYTMVTIIYGGYAVDIIDTRYDNDVLHDFGAWCEAWLTKNLDPNLHPIFIEV